MHRDLMPKGRHEWLDVLGVWAVVASALLVGLRGVAQLTVALAAWLQGP